MTTPSLVAGRSSAVLFTRPVVTRSQPSHIRARVEIAAHEAVFTGHYPQVPILPGVALLDLIEQTVRLTAAHESLRSDVHSLLLLRLVRPVRPGTTLELHLDVERRHPIWRVKARITAADELVANAIVSFRLAGVS